MIDPGFLSNTIPSDIQTFANAHSRQTIAWSFVVRYAPIFTVVPFVVAIWTLMECHDYELHRGYYRTELLFRWIWIPVRQPILLVSLVSYFPHVWICVVSEIIHSIPERFVVICRSKRLFSKAIIIIVFAFAIVFFHGRTNLILVSVV